MKRIIRLVLALGSVWGLAGGQTPALFEDHHLIAPDEALSDGVGTFVSVSGDAGFVRAPSVEVAMNSFGPNIIDFDGGPTGGFDLEVTEVDMHGGFVFADGSIDAASAGVVGPAFDAAGVTVYRIWVHVASATGTVLFAGGSVDNALDLIMNSSNGLFVNVEALSGDTAESIDPAFMPFIPEIAWDSYVTIGGAASTDLPIALGVVDTDNVLNGLMGNVLGQNVGWFFEIPPAPGVGVVSDGAGGWRVLLAQLTVAQGESIEGWMQVIGGGEFVYYHFQSPPPVIINVPGDFATIQEAIDASTVSGDEIIVAPGTYPEVINFNGKVINLHSASGNPADTIIDGTGLNESVVLCISGEGSGTILEGFTITGGTGHDVGFGDMVGGGMFNDGSSPTVSNCMFNGNSVTSLGSNGGGMANSNSSPIVTNCTFSGNSATVAGNGGGMVNSNNSSPIVTNCIFSANSACSGGGMYNDNSSPMVTNSTFSGNSTLLDGGGMLNRSSSPTVTNCTFSGNSASTGSGGGMSNELTSSPIVTNCTFSGNSISGIGGGMNNTGSSPTITNCTFSNNFTPGDGGGMANSGSSPTVTNCIFSGNTIQFNGGGMFNAFNSSPTVTNCAFSGNSASSGGGMANSNNSNPTVTNCILWGDSPDEIFNASSTPTVSFSDVQGGLGAGSIDGGGNIDVNPLFIDADGPDNIPGTPDDDLQLLGGSPVIDAGSNTAVPPDTADLDGDGDILEPTPLDLASNPRFLDDPGTIDTGAGTAPIVDMGAYEFSGISGDIVFDPPNETQSAGAPNIVTVGNLDTSGGSDPPDVAAVIPDADPAVNGVMQVFLNQGTDVGGGWLGLVANPDIPVGPDPTGIALGSFDNDAFLDIAVTNAGDGTVMIFINDGSGLGTFNPPTTFALNPGEVPQAIAALDINGDGLDDLAVASSGANNLVIWENQPGAPGTFNAGQLIPVGDGPRDIDPADKDNDKDLDLIVTNFGSNTVSVLDFDAATGLFSVQATIAVGQFPVDAAVGDLDGNGFIDFVTANSDGTLSVVLNQGLGVFDAAFSVPVGTDPRAVDLGDFDADGDLDLVVAADDPVIGPSIQALENFVGAGGGLVFSAPIAFSVGADPNFVVTTDLDGDGASDVITVNNDAGATGGSVTALLNSPPCVGDITPPGGNGEVNIDDLIALLAAFGTCQVPLPSCPADITPPGGNGTVNIDDLISLLGAFGPCP